MSSSSLRVGIVGLPNVGKSTLFKALTRKAVDINNYPFCTIEPNVGIVEVPDDRLALLATMSGTKKIIPAVIEFVDIAGLVKGASEGEGLGNKFLANIREVDAIVEVVRVFENPDIIHVHNTIDPANDVDVINTELIMADMETVTKRKLKTGKDARAGKKEAMIEMAVLEKLEVEFQAGRLPYVIVATLSLEEKKVVKSLQLLTTKPFLYVYNVSDIDRALSPELENRPHVKLDIKIEEELIEMSPEEIADMGLVSHIGDLANQAYALLGLMTYFTTGVEETRAWTIPLGSTAPQAGSAIHNDFEERFIRAEVIHFTKLLEVARLSAGKDSWSAARDTGALRLEGKNYIVSDGDVMVFKI